MNRTIDVRFGREVDHRGRAVLRKEPREAVRIDDVALDEVKAVKESLGGTINDVVVAATTGAVRDHHFQLAYDAFIADENVREFIGENNAPGLREMSEKFLEALSRDLWTPRSNSVYHELMAITGARDIEIAGAVQ